MELSELECDLLLDYKNNSPLELLKNAQVDANDYILLSLMLKRNNCNQYLEELLTLLQDVERGLINKNKEQLEWSMEVENFAFHIKYECTNEGDYADGDPTLQVDMEFELVGFDLVGEELLPLSASKYMNARFDELVNEYPY